MGETMSLWRRCAGAIVGSAVVLLAWLPRTSVAASEQNPNIIVIDASKPAVPPAPLPAMGGKSASGHEIAVNSRYLTLDGRPWLPVMGEFHYSRYPEQYWEEELLKMKAGGVQIVSTYVFWIHHEEVEGQFDWSGRRNLRRFVELCQKHGLYVFLRIGPYAHGEVRNGGLPDWVVARGSTRRNNPRYLASVRLYFEQIGQQVQGLFWKDGGPILSVQLENEYSLRGPDAGAAHIAELKKMARAAGLEAPLYTVTGWDNAAFPAGEVIPVLGGYVDNFWDSSLHDLPPAGYYLFESKQATGDIPGKPGGPSVSYPLFMAEAGGGMQSAYHRRPVIGPDDVAAMTLTQLGSGVNLYGYYMFQGGANPSGELSSLQESIATDHVYDLPQVSYDFQAPLGEFGATRSAFRAIRPFHLFLNAFGEDLAPMVPVFPKIAPQGPSDRTTLRVAARVQGDRGFVFVNNYQRLYPLADHSGVQIRLILPAETLLLPQRPTPIPSGAYAIWPVNLNLQGVLLKYATAQLITMVANSDEEAYFFFVTPGIPAEFAFDDGSVASVEAPRASITRLDGRIYVDAIGLGLRSTITLRSRSGKTIRIFVLSREDAERLSTAEIAKRRHVLISSADVFDDDATLYLHTRSPKGVDFAVFPEVPGALSASVSLQRATTTEFIHYTADVHAEEALVRWRKTQEPGTAPPVRKGKYNAMAPTEADFVRAGVWQITLPPNAFNGLSDIFLRVDYIGDVARLYSGHRLLADNYYNGVPWEIGLKRFAPEIASGPLFVKIVPLRKDAPIYIPRDAWPSFPASGQVAKVKEITALPEYEVQVTLPKPGRGGGKAMSSH